MTQKLTSLLLFQSRVVEITKFSYPPFQVTDLNLTILPISSVFMGKVMESNSRTFRQDSPPAVKLAKSERLFLRYVLPKCMKIHCHLSTIMEKISQGTHFFQKSAKLMWDLRNFKCSNILAKLQNSLQSYTSSNGGSYKTF